MNMWIKKTISVGALSLGLVAVTGAAAQASPAEDPRTEGWVQISHGNSGILTGNNIAIPIQIVGNICGNGVGVAGLGIGASNHCVAVGVQH
ncbi:chaplin family protein [Longispora albida]|uniref:chaplin family protein n=1 Tax=Longispora albida TaxID=203523 RepID=UPI000372FD53|nr:chaplin family protein [Longispora albida]